MGMSNTAVLLTKFVDFVPTNTHLGLVLVQEAVGNLLSVRTAEETIRHFTSAARNTRSELRKKNGEEWKLPQFGKGPHSHK